MVGVTPVVAGRATSSIPCRMNVPIRIQLSCKELYAFKIEYLKT